MTTKQLPVIELTPEDEEWLHQIPGIIDPGELVSKGQPGVGDVHIASTLTNTKRRKRKRRRLRDLLKHAYQGSDTHSTGTGQEVHAGGEGSFMGGHTQFDVVGGFSSEQRAADLKTATDRLAEGKPLYRGMGVVFPDDFRSQLESILVPAMEPEEVGQHLRAGPMILDYVTTNGVGRHWTTSKGWAELAAELSGGQGPQKNQWNVIVEIEPPDVSSLSPIQDRLGMSENEVTLDPNGVYTYKSLIVQGGTWWDNQNLLETPITKRDIRKHAATGPGGTHPGTGTSQDVHGGGGGGASRKEVEPEGGAVPLKDRVRKWEGQALDRFHDDLWSSSGAHSKYTMSGGDVRDESDWGIARVGELMRQDPRWDDAEEEWSNLSTEGGAAYDEVYAEAESLQVGFWSVAGEMGIDWDQFGGNEPEVWQLEEIYSRVVVGQGTDTADTGFYAPDADEIEAMIGTVHSVGTTDVESMIKSDYDMFGVENPRWRVLAIDPDGTVTLERQADMMDTVGDGLGPWKDLGALAGGGADGMGPEVMETTVDTIFIDDENSQGERLTVLSKTLYDDVGDSIVDLDRGFNDFYQSYGTTPSTAVNAIEMGDYSVFNGSPAGIGTSESLIVGDSYGESSGVMLVTTADQVPMGLRNLWADTSADEHRWALALQMAVADEFGLKTVPMESLIGRSMSVRKEAMETYEEFETGLRVYARAVYNTTQEALAKYDGIEGALPVARGMGLSKAVYDEHYSAVPIDKGRWIRETGKNPVAVWTPVEVTLNPLSSFTTSVSTAKAFSNRGTGTYQSLTRAWVPREQIWGISTLGHGSYRESEVIVLGGDDSLAAEMRIS